MLIRKIEDSDIESVLALWRDCEITRPWNDPERDIAFARENDNSVVLLGIIDEKIIATVMAGHDGHRGWVYYLVVTPERRGENLGTKMVLEAEKWLRNKGVWKANLMVRGDNAGAIRFYERIGYKTADVICLQKKIAP